MLSCSGGSNAMEASRWTPIMDAGPTGGNPALTGHGALRGSFSPPPKGGGRTDFEASVAIHELASLTWEEVRDLDRSRTVALLPVGALEAHGPHLPLATDVVIAEGMARAGAVEIERLGLHALVLPPLPLTPAPFGAGFAGTLSVAPATLVALALDLARELTRHGFAALAIANAHLDPAHRAALARVVARARAERLLPVVAPDLAQKPWASRLGEEFRTGACHAGR